jgi:chromosome segregation ATPase
MSRTLFEDDLGATDFRKTAAYDIQTDIGYEDIKIRSKFQSKFLKEQNEIYILRLELERVENDQYETIRDCKRQLRELEQQTQDRRASREQAEQIAALETARRTQAIEEEVTRQSREQQIARDRFSQRKSQIRSEIAAVKQQIEDSNLLHQTRVAKLRNALEEFREELRDATERKLEIEASSDTLRHTSDSLESRLEKAAVEYDSVQALLQTVRDDLERMEADYNELCDAS